MIPTDAAVLDVDDSTFEAEVLRSPVPVLVDFGAPWCPPCRALEPILESLAAASRGQFRIVRVNPETARQTAARYGVRALPSLLLFRHGTPAGSRVGRTTREGILELVGGG